MQREIEQAMRQALDARAQADACVDTGMREEWLHVARMWDDLIQAYEEHQQLAERLTVFATSVSG